MGYTPSKYQQAILQWVQEGRGDAIVQARAGAGKTSTLVMIAGILKGRGLFCAFNKHIQLELEKRLAGTNMVTKTMHGYGYGILANECKRNGLRLDVRDKKYRELAEMACEINPGLMAKPYEYARKVDELARIARLTLAPLDDLSHLRDLMSDYELDDEDWPEAVYMAICQLAPGIIRQGILLFQRAGQIDFADMVYLPVALRMQGPMFDWVLCDESQDLSACQIALVMSARSPGGRMVFVGDSAQAIYHFSGADANSFASIQTRTDAVLLPLNICYRCPSSHLDLAREIVPDIENRPDAPLGIVETIDYDKLAEPGGLREGDLILCRVNAPLIELCIYLITKRLPAKVKGKDVGDQLVKLLEKLQDNIKALTYENFIENLDHYRMSETIRFSRRPGNEGKIQRLEDMCEALGAIYEGFDDVKSLAGLKDAITSLFSDERGSIWLSSVHKAKGLEADRVFILHPEKMPLTWKNQGPTQAEQEMNIKYVALTRAKAYLAFINSANKQKVESKPVTQSEIISEPVSAPPDIQTVWDVTADLTPAQRDAVLAYAQPTGRHAPVHGRTLSSLLEKGLVQSEKQRNGRGRIEYRNVLTELGKSVAEQLKGKVHA